MFDIGFKQVVINNGDLVVAETIDAVNYINIEGFGKFVVGGSSLNVTRVPEPSVVGTTTITGAPTGWAADQVWEIKLHVTEGEGAGGFGEVRESGQIVYYQVGMPLILDGSVPPTTFAAMLQIAVDTFKRSTGVGSEFSYITFNGTTFSFEPGYEGFTIEQVLATKIYDPQLPSFDDRLSPTENITGIVTPGSFGFGYPKQVEESVRNNTPFTLYPYGVQEGGNEVIDFSEGSAYTEVTWFTSQDHYAGTEPHLMLGYGDSNTETIFNDRKYSVNIQWDNAAAIALLESI